MRQMSIRMRSTASLCGIALGLLVLANTGSLMALEASDVVGGLWYTCSEGDSCGGNTTLYCRQGGSYGYSHCQGGAFSGRSTRNRRLCTHSELMVGLHEQSVLPRRVDVLPRCQREQVSTWRHGERVRRVLS